MPKRFTDSEKFRDRWYRNLSPKHKCIWEYMLSECTIAGILEIDLQAMSFHIGDNIDQSDIDLFQDKIFYLTEDKIFIPRFIKFQQKELSHNNNAHKNIINELEKYNIPLSLDMQEFESPKEAPSKPLARGTGNSKGNSNSIGISKLNENLEKKAVDLYNAMASEVGLPQAQKITDTRKSKIRARLKDCGGIDGWKAALTKVESSGFLTGQKTDWKADLDFILQESSFVKIMEGKYDDAKPRPTTTERNKQAIQEWVDGR